MHGLLFQPSGKRKTNTSIFPHVTFVVRRCLKNYSHYIIAVVIICNVSEIWVFISIYEVFILFISFSQESTL